MERSPSRALAIGLLVVAVVLVLFALLGTGNQMWTALAGMLCALVASALWTTGSRARGSR